MNEIEQLRKQILDLERDKRATEAARKATIEFMARTTHEIRNFLNTILGFVDLLQDTTLSSEQQIAVEAVERGGRQLLTLANDLLDLASVEIGRTETDRVVFDLVDLAEDVVRAAAVWARGKKIDVRSKVDADIAERVYGDAHRLRQVLTNLLQNAIKFTEAGHVVLSMERRDSRPGSVRFVVSDTGVGIAADRLQSIFEPFSQADPSIGRRFGGSGLGLAISKRLVERMGGTISAKSTVGVGTTIHVSFDFEVAPDDDRSQRVLRLGGRDILVVDDSSERAELRDILTNWGANVTEIADGQAALDELRRGRGTAHAAIVLAARMRAVSGLSIVHELRSDRALLSKIVVLLPIDHRRGDLAALKELGVGATVLKPLKRSELLQAIERAVMVEPTPPFMPRPTGAQEEK
jgi:two-component system, sensor histidine kinase and response regulator